MKKFLFLLGAVALLAVFGAEALDLHSVISSVPAEVTMFTTLATAPLTLADLRKEADKLSNFSGDYGSGVSFYTGEGDDLLAFAGSMQNFAGELVEHLEKQFVVTIVNANAAKRTAVLFAGYLKGNSTLAPGQLIEGAFNDINGNAGLTGATASEKSIEEMQLFINSCPTRLLAIKIKSTVADQVSESFTYQRLSPFQTLPTKIIRPDNFQNQDTYQDKIATFPCNVQMDDQAKLVCPVVGSSTLRISFFFGTSLNVALALERKASRAHAGIAAAGQSEFVQQQVAAKALGA